MSRRSRTSVGSIRLFAAGIFGIAMMLQGGCANGPPPTETELGEQALARGEWRVARIHFTLALGTDAQDGRAWLGQAKAQIGERDPEAALASLASLVKVDPARFRDTATPTYADALEGAAVGRLNRKQTSHALEAVRALQKLDPARAGLDRLLGNALLAEAGRLRLQGQPQAAFVLYQEATRVVPQRLAGWLGAAEIMIESNQGKGAVRFLEAARRYHPTSGEIRMLSIQAISSR